MTMPSSLTTKANWETTAAKKAADEFIDQCTDSSREAVKNSAYEAIDSCASSLQSLKDEASK